MSFRITFRLGDTIPTSETPEIGEPYYDASKYRLGIGWGGAQPLWYGKINPNNGIQTIENGLVIGDLANSHVIEQAFKIPPTSITFDIMAAGASSEKTITVNGLLAANRYAFASYVERSANSNNLPLQLEYFVTSNDTVTIRAVNQSGSSVTPVAMLIGGYAFKL
jgi:hypothetical protein